MLDGRVAAWVGRCLVAAAAPLLSAGTTLTANFEQRVLAAHNRERTALGIPSLQWDSRLAQSARTWANHLAVTGGFEHAQERADNPEGENLWSGSKGRFAAEAMVDGWVREKRNFKPGVFPHNSVTGNVADVGHYTQVMWRDTGAVGCAMATGAVEDVLVCRYAQAGNFVGERPF